MIAMHARAWWQEALRLKYEVVLTAPDGKVVDVVTRTRTKYGACSEITRRTFSPLMDAWIVFPGGERYEVREI